MATKDAAKRQDPFEAIQKAVTCSFCLQRMSDVVKLIPDCGKFICGECYDELIQSLENESREFKCLACEMPHHLPQNGLADCKQLLDLLRQSIKKPVPPQANELRTLIGNIQEQLIRIKAFDSKEHIEQHCQGLEIKISDAAESAIQHIHEIETELLTQANQYRQRCLDALETRSPNGQLDASANELKIRLDSLSKEIGQFNEKWIEYFRQLDSYAMESEIEAALSKGDRFQARIDQLEQELKSSAFREPMMQLTENESFISRKDHLGELVKVSPDACLKAIKGKLVPEDPLMLRFDHPQHSVLISRLQR